MLSFDTVTTWKGLLLLRDDWARLDDGRTPGAVFRSWEWQATWWRILGQGNGHSRRLQILCGRDEKGRLRGILPLYSEGATIGGLLPSRRVGFLADGVVGSDYLGLIAPLEEQAALSSAFARELVSHPALRRADQVELDDMLADDPLVQALTVRLGEAGYEEVTTLPRYRCPHARLDRQDLETYLATRPNGFGSQYRQRRRSLEKQVGFRIDVYRDAERIVKGLQTLFALHRARWAEEGGSSAFTNERVEKFHGEAARLLAERGWARLGLLSLGGKAVAAGYGFARDGQFAYYQTGLEPAWRKRSAGTVLLGELITRAYDERLGDFDFLRGDEAYKTIWSTEVRQTCGLRAHPGHGRARISSGMEHWLLGLRAGVHRALPHRAVGAIRYVLRRMGH